MKFAEVMAKKASNIAANHTPVIAFLGDSVTQGCFESYEGSPCDFESVYHARLKRMLAAVYPKVPVNILNAGVGGDNARKGLERLERDVLPYSPDLAVICFGLNDAANGKGGITDYTDALHNIFHALKMNGIETIFMTPNMMNSRICGNINPAYADYAEITAKVQNEGVMDAYMESACKLCAGDGVAVCDCYKKWKLLDAAGVDTTMLLANYINHPARHMHKLFAASLFDTIFFRK